MSVAHEDFAISTAYFNTKFIAPGIISFYISLRMILSLYLLPPLSYMHPSFALSSINTIWPEDVYLRSYFIPAFKTLIVIVFYLKTRSVFRP